VAYNVYSLRVASFAINRSQRRHQRLVLELLTNLFNGYRAMRYQTSLLTEAAGQSQRAHLEALRWAAMESEEARAKIDGLEKMCAQLRASAGVS
jgi:hypothetical protein